MVAFALILTLGSSVVVAALVVVATVDVPVDVPVEVPVLEATVEVSVLTSVVGPRKDEVDCLSVVMWPIVVRPTEPTTIPVVSGRVVGDSVVVTPIASTWPKIPVVAAAARQQVAKRTHRMIVGSV